MSDTSFVRTEMLPEKAPPSTTVGFVGWLRANLFSSWINSIITIIGLYFIYSVLAGVTPWIFQSVWYADNLKECREIMMERWGETHGHACWAVIRDRWHQLLFGFYPTELYWRPVLAMGLLTVGLVPILFREVESKWLFVAAGVYAVLGVMVLFGGTNFPATIALFFTAALFVGATQVGRDKLIYVTLLYPFLMPWLMWGGTIWPPICAALGFVIGYYAINYATKSFGSLAGMIIGVLAALVWWLVLSGYVSDGLSSILPIGIEAVESRKFGGYMLALLLGVVAIGASLPLGILLALGRQSDLMIVKAICVGFIEFIRGVPLITLLFVASLLLNLFLPPSTNFDIILRVMIMMTFFSAAYMAEVIRGGMAALPTGQYEGADSLGLDYWQATRLIIMPQALKISIPGIVSTFIGVFKDTTLVSIIGLLDVIGFANAIRGNTDWQGIYWELFAFIAVLFFFVCFGMSRYSMYLERKLKTTN